jgi:hypothetical protein
VRVDVAASPDVTYDYYYNEQWQLLEERKDGDTDPLNQYLWHPYYIDALAIPPSRSLLDWRIGLVWIGVCFG